MQVIKDLDRFVQVTRVAADGKLKRQPYIRRSALGVEIHHPPLYPAADLAAVVEATPRELIAVIRQQPHSSPDLEEIADELNYLYFDSQLEWSSITYAPMAKGGVCFPAPGIIRLNYMFRSPETPPAVREYYVMHELAHLLYPGHSMPFWACVYRSPSAHHGHTLVKGGYHEAVRRWRQKAV